jgi:hypothetical protein
MGILILLLLLILIAACGALLILLGFLLLHIRSVVRNTFRMATLLFAWAVQAGFIGFAAYIAAWVFMFPVMAAICCVAGIARTWAGVRFARQARRQAGRA